MLAQGEPSEEGEGVTGEAEDEGQEQVGPGKAGSVQPEEGGKGVSNSDTPEEARHDLVELHLATLENGMAEKDQGFQQKQHGHMSRAFIIPGYRKDRRDNAHARQLTSLHAADTTLELHGPNTRQDAQRRQHHNGGRGQDHIQQRRDAHCGHQNSRL